MWDHRVLQNELWRRTARPLHTTVNATIRHSTGKKTMKELFALRCSPTSEGLLLCLKVPSLRPLVLLVIAKTKMVARQWRTVTDREKQKFREKILSQWQFFCYKSHVNWPEREFGISQWETVNCPPDAQHGSRRPALNLWPWSWTFTV